MHGAVAPTGANDLSQKEHVLLRQREGHRRRARFVRTGTGQRSGHYL